MIAWSELRFYPPVFNLGEALSSSSAEVRLLGFKVRGSERPAECMAGSYSIHRVNSTAEGLAGKANCFLRMLIWIAWSAVSWRPTCVVAHGSQALPIAAIAAILSRRKLVYYAHELSCESAGTSWLRLAGVLEMQIARRCAIVACASSDRAEILQKRLQLTKRPVVVDNAPLRNAMNCSCHVETAVSYARKQTELAEHVLVYTGRIGENVGMREICGALDMLPQNYVLVVAGAVDRGFAEEFRRLTRSSKVFYYGVVPYAHLRRWLQGADAGLVFYKAVNANTTFAAPGKMYEYVAAGLPVVCNSFPLGVQLIQENGLGECVSEISPECIASAALRVSAEKKVEDCSQDCVSFFESNLSYEHRANDLIHACLSAS